MNLNTSKIAVIGMGYVGLPLATAFAEHFAVVGYDINHQRIKEIEHNFDATNEIADQALNALLKKENDSTKGLYASHKEKDIANANIYIITVPTPVNKYKIPDLRFLKKASLLVAKHLKVNDLVIYESTTYPGCTQEFCIPILEKESGLALNDTFFVGYSPERISPGDAKRRLKDICKITSGSNEKTAEFVNQLYCKIIAVGTHRAASIKVAEAAKSIENAQRDLNISFMNELSMLFDKLDLDTFEVLEAAKTKWNFLDFVPGLVGGHCIGVDPYYLTYKAQELGYNPAVILSGRRVNDNMGNFVAQRVIKLLVKSGVVISKAKILIMGITFKKDCPDTRNSKVASVYKELKEFGCQTTIYDPWVAESPTIEGDIIPVSNQSPKEKYDAVIYAVSHKQFKTQNITDYTAQNAVVFDCTGTLPKTMVSARL